MYFSLPPGGFGEGDGTTVGGGVGGGGVGVGGVGVGPEPH